jgi:hypothetical protein
MKNHSDNIKISAGLIPIHNLNVFTHYNLHSKASSITQFYTSLERINLLVSEMLLNLERLYGHNSHAINLEYGHSLPLLSIPRFEIIDRHKYKLLGGLFIFDNKLFHPGVIFSIDYYSLIVHTPELVENVNITPIQINYIEYDSYRSSNVQDIDEDIISELDLPALNENDLEMDGENRFINGIKTLAIYSPEIDKVKFPSHRTIGVVIDTDNRETIGLDFDRIGFDQIFNSYTFNKNNLNSKYSRIDEGNFNLMYFDTYLIEFVKLDSVYSYAIVESFGRFTPTPDLDNMHDIYSKYWNGDGNKQEFSNHTIHSILGTYCRILDQY